MEWYLSTYLCFSRNHTALLIKMTVVESVKSAVGGTASGARMCSFFLVDCGAAQRSEFHRTLTSYFYTTATRQEMSDARLPLAYRDSCAGLLIPLNRCRYEEYYLPWKCEVRTNIGVIGNRPLRLSVNARFFQSI